MVFFFFNDTATTEIYTLSLHDALPIYGGEPLSAREGLRSHRVHREVAVSQPEPRFAAEHAERLHEIPRLDRKSTRLNSSHANISYAVFCLKKKNTKILMSLTASLVRSY